MPATQVETRAPDTERAVTALLAAPAGITPSTPAADPIFAAIGENRRLFDAWTEAGELPLNSIDPAPEARAAGDAFHAHCNDMLLRTVPQTAAGCAALARYAHDFVEREGWTLDQQDEDATDHLRILDLIARSPMLTAPDSPPATPDPIFAALDAARAPWDALNAHHDKHRHGPVPGYDVEHETALFKAASKAWAAVFATTPTTPAGLQALIAFAEQRIDEEATTDGTQQDGEDTVFGEAYRALVRAIRIERSEPRLDLAELTMAQLANLARVFEASADRWCEVTCMRWTGNDEAVALRTLSPAGRIADAEYGRQAALLEQVMAEIEKRPSKDESERDVRLSALIRRELAENEGLQYAPGLRAVIAEQWGAAA